MTTIDNIMALALNYRLAGSASRDEHEEALRTALTEALAFSPDWADFQNGRECGRLEATEALEAQPVREPLTNEQMLNAIKHLYKNEWIAEQALDVSLDDFRAIERAHGIGGDK